MPNSITFYKYTTYCLSIPSLVCSELGDFYFSSLMNNVSISACLQVFIQTYVFNFLGYSLRVQLLSHVVNSCLTFEESAKLFLYWAAPFYILNCNV